MMIEASQIHMGLPSLEHHCQEMEPYNIKL